MQDYIRLKSRVDELQQEIEYKEVEIKSLNGTLTEKQQRIQNLRSQGLAFQPADYSGSSTTINVAGSPNATSGVRNLNSFSLAYEGGVSCLNNKRYDEAADIFTSIINTFPSHALTSNCHYWRGEALFKQGDYLGAIEAFNAVLEFPLSLKKDDALMMLGQSFVQLNRTEEARRAFNRLIQEHPTSEFVMKAEEMLNRL